MNNLILQSFVNVALVPFANAFRLIAKPFRFVGRVLGMIHPVAILSRILSGSVWYVLGAIIIAEVFAVRWIAEYAVSDLNWEPGLILMTVVMPGLMFIVFKWLFLMQWMREYRSLVSLDHPTSITQ